MERISFTPYGCELGDALRSLRERYTNSTGAAFASQLGWDASKVSNIELGKARASEIDLVQWFTACGKGRREQAEFAEKYRCAFDPYIALPSSNLTTVAFAERTASSIACSGIMRIPDLLRTEECTEQLLQCLGASEEEIRSAVQAQQRRQEVVRHLRAPACVFYVAEKAIRARLAYGDGIDGLRERLIRAPGVLRVVPESRKLFYCTDFTLYEYERGIAAAFVDCDIAKIFVQDDAAIARCRKTLVALDETALSPAESHDLIDALFVKERRSGFAVVTDEKSANRRPPAAS